MKTTDSFYNKLDEPNRSCLEALRITILQYDVAINEAIKYGMPFFSYNESRLCYLWIDKKTTMPYIGFVHGKKLPFKWLEAGERIRMKILHIDPYADLPVKKIREVLKMSIEIVKQ
jgi:hypothetical protein